MNEDTSIGEDQPRPSSTLMEATIQQHKGGVQSLISQFEDNEGLQQQRLKHKNEGSSSSTVLQNNYKSEFPEFNLHSKPNPEEINDLVQPNPKKSKDGDHQFSTASTMQPAYKENVENPSQDQPRSYKNIILGQNSQTEEPSIDIHSSHVDQDSPDDVPMKALDSPFWTSLKLLLKPSPSLQSCRR